MDLAIPLSLSTAGNIKSGTISSGSFGGLPLSASVVFVTPFSTANYSPAIESDAIAEFGIQSKTANGFTVTTNIRSSNMTISNAYWICVLNGEY